MADRAKKPGDGSFGAEVIGKPSRLQRKVEELLEQEARKPARKADERQAVVHVLKGGSESPESGISHRLLARAQEVLEELKGMNKEEQAEYRARILEAEPEVIAALPLAYETSSQLNRVKIKDHLLAVDRIMAGNHGANALLDQAAEELGDETLAELEQLKKASGD